MRQRIVGVFDRRESARRAAAALADSGFGADVVRVGGGDDSAVAAERAGLLDGARSFVAEVFGPAAGQADTLRREGALVEVDVETDAAVDVEAARRALEHAGALAVEARGEAQREPGWHGELAAADFDATRAAGALGTHAVPGTAVAGDTRTGDGTGDGTGLDTAAARVPHTAGSIGLPDETVGMRAARAQPLAPGGEGMPARRPWEDFAEGFHADWRTHYAADGGRFDDWEPAYRHGYALRGGSRHAGQSWEAIEPDARRDWERRHPGRPWERFAEAVRHAWERATD